MIAIVHTTREPARGFVDRLQALEGRDGVLSISLTHGFPWGDVADMGTKVLVYTDGDAAAAQALARQLADELIGLRERLSHPMPGIDEALDQALAAPAGPVVIADGADNPGGGAAGDSTFMLRRLVERGVDGRRWARCGTRRRCASPSRPAPGARLPLRIGGKTSPLSGDPLDADCTVLALQPRHGDDGLAGTPMPLGDCAWVRLAAGVAGGADLAVRNQAMGTDLFTGAGLRRWQPKRLVVVKSVAALPCRLRAAGPAGASTAQRRARSRPTCVQPALPQATAAAVAARDLNARGHGTPVKP
jgi:microcystin degradation protein MlrC